MLHLEQGAIAPSAWGAVLDYPLKWKNSIKTRNLFGSGFSEIVEKEFKIKGADIEKSRPVLIRVGAVCDYAQKQSGPMPYVFGVERPVSIKTDKTSDSVWASPRFITNDEVPFTVVASARYLVSLPVDAVQGMTVRYRLREQLLMELIGKVSHHIARPGKIFV
jgi:hypothetical protein